MGYIAVCQKSEDSGKERFPYERKAVLCDKRTLFIMPQLDLFKNFVVCDYHIQSTVLRFEKM